jgi:hypothetical protein
MVGHWKRMGEQDRTRFGPQETTHERPFRNERETIATTAARPLLTRIPRELVRPFPQLLFLPPGRPEQHLLSSISTVVVKLWWLAASFLPVRWALWTPQQWEVS